MLQLMVSSCDGRYTETKNEKVKLLSKKSVSKIEQISKYIVYQNYKLKIETLFSTDSIATIDYRTDVCATPIIMHQKLSFFKDEQLIKSHVAQILTSKKETISGSIIDALKTPIYEICVNLTGGEACYVVNGADCCNGQDCKEFTGIYSLDGRVEYESTSTKNKESTLKLFLLKYKINLNKNVKCMRTDNFE